MEASLTMYIPGAIVRYDAPFKKKVCDQYGIPSSHPVLIMNQTTIPDSSFQCMLVSSQVDRYYGYRLYLNTTDPTYKRMSVICTNHIYTIERMYLRDILGFIPKDLMERCRRAYAWEIGLSDVMPDYYQADETCVGWINAGQPNVPDVPNPFDLKEGGVEAGRQIAIAVAHRPYKPGIDGITNFPLRARMVNPTIDQQVIHGMPISTQFSSGTEEDNSGEFDMEDGRSTAPAKDPLDGNEPPKPPEEVPPETTPRKRQTHKFPRMNWELFARIENHAVPPFVKYKEMRDYIAKVPLEKQFEIFMRKHNGLDLYNLGLAPSRRIGDAMIGFLIKRIEDDKVTILDGVISGSMNWKRLANRFIPALQAMTIREIREIHMGKDKYFEILDVYGIARHQSYIGECEANDIFAESLPAEKFEELGIPHRVTE